MPKRTCTVDGCERKHRAKGLCASHYAQARYTPEQRHPKVTVDCAYCGEPCQKYKSDNRFKHQFCSYLCRDLFRLDETNGDPMAAARKASQAIGPRICRLPPEHPVMWVGTWEPVAFGACGWCGAMTCRGQLGTRAYCSKGCKRRAKACRRRGREAQDFGFWTWFDFMHIARRFDFRCAYCGDKPSDPLQPDHVVPVSKGGANTIANLLPACMPCNADKRDLLLDEWAADRERRGLPQRLTSWAPEDRRFHHLTSVTTAAA